MKQSGLLLLALAVIGPGAAWAGDGLVALQTADPSCPDDSGNIYVNCGNGYGDGQSERPELGSECELFRARDMA